MKRITFLVLLTSFAIAVSAADAASYDGQIKVISEAKYYSWGWVGTPSKPSDAEVAAREISGKVTAKKLSLAINNSSNEGRLYFLCLLHGKDKKAFRQKVDALYQSSDVLVSEYSGNILQRVSAKSIVERIGLHGCEPLSWGTSAGKNIVK